MKKILNLHKIILLIMVFVTEFFLINVSYKYFKNDWIFDKSWLIFSGKIFFATLKNLKSFFEKKDAFDCAGIRAWVFRLPVDSRQAIERFQI